MTSDIVWNIQGVAGKFSFFPIIVGIFSIIFK